MCLCLTPTSVHINCTVSTFCKNVGRGNRCRFFNIDLLFNELLYKSNINTNHILTDSSLRVLVLHETDST